MPRRLGTRVGRRLFGGWADRIISRIVDVWMAFPPVLFAILLVAVLGTGLGSVIIAIAVIDWTRFCRVVRAEAMSQTRMDYTENARIAGFGRLAIMMREVFPNVLPSIIALLSLEMGIAVIVEAILSFVNLSISTDDPTWGGIIAGGPALHPSGLVGAGVPVDHTVPHRTFLQPVRRRAQSALRPGAPDDRSLP